MLIHRTSILLVSSRDGSSRVVRVPTHLLRYWGWYLLVAGVLGLWGVVHLCCYIHGVTSSYYEAELAEADYLCSQIDVAKAEAAFASVDSTIFRINACLSARGLEGLALEPIGCEAVHVANVHEWGGSYSAQLGALEELLERLPFGLPHRGRVTSEFGYRRHPISRRRSVFHDGIDIKGCRGDVVICPGAGVVEFSGYKWGYGKCVIVRHAHELKTLYAHLHRIDVRVGEAVRSGQCIGLLGNTGWSTGAHLHYEVIKEGRKVNPRNFFSFNDVLEDEETPS